MSRRLDRRTALRGLGTAMALPWLEAMAPSTLSRAAARVRRRIDALAGRVHLPAQRSACPSGCFRSRVATRREVVRGRDRGCDGGCDGADRRPLPGLLEPLERAGSPDDPHRPRPRERATLGDGPGDTRCRRVDRPSSEDRGPGHREQDLDRSGGRGAAPGRDQFPNIEIGCEPTLTAGNCDSGYSCARANIAWKSPRTPIAKEVSPRASSSDCS